MNEQDAHATITEQPPAMSSATAGWLVALVGWTALLSFQGLAGGACFEPTDCWVSQTAREMYQDGTIRGLIVPTFSGERRMQKSPGPYWAVMLTAWLRGQDDIDEVSARIPNGLAAILIVVTVFWLTRRIAGDRAAIFAGFACSASIMTLYWSHRGASDLGLAAFTTLALAAVWIAAEREPPGARRNVIWLLGYFAAGLGMLYKLPMSLPVVGAPVFVYVLIRNRWRVLADRIHLWGLLVFLLPWLPWVIAVAMYEPTALAKWKVEFWDRFTGDLPNVEGQRAWYFHFVYLIPPIVYCIPFSLSLPRAATHVFRRQPGVNRDGMIYAGVWFLSLFAFFTISAGKELRYFLPALPPLFVLLGVELAAFFDPQRASDARADRRGVIAVWTLMPLGFAGGAYGVYRWYVKIAQPEGFTWAEVWQPYAGVAAVFTLGSALAAWLYLRRRRNASFGALVVTMWLTWVAAWSYAMPVFVSQRSFLDFAAQLRERIDPALQANMRQIGSQDSRITWYSDYRFQRIIDQLELLRMQGGSRSVERETELVGEEMVNQLAGDDLVLLVASRPHYVDFLVKAPPKLAKRGQTMPPVHLWLQTEVGTKMRQFILFGNRPPPWPEPALNPPSERFDGAASVRAVPRVAEPVATTTRASDSQPTTSSASQPSGGG